ncbi:MAG: DUF1592 domain-containing protein [Oligoflexus sp.]|nr:DUF1592 domain-containing protein [Oligoflexus sp.]
MTATKQSWLKPSIVITLILIGTLSTQCTSPPNPARPNNKKPAQGAEVPNDTETDAQDAMPNDGSDFSHHNENFAAIVKAVDSNNCPAEVKGKPQSRIITRKEWIQTINEVLGANLNAESFETNLPPQTQPPSNVPYSDYDHLQNYNKMSIERLLKYTSANKILADQIVASQAEKIISCNDGSAKACVAKWLNDKLPALWKKPSNPEDNAALLAFFEKSGANKLGFGLMLERILLSHNFLYRSNLGLSGQLSSWEVASSLADSLWDSPVTGELKDLANADGLRAKADIERQVAKMIEDPKFYRGVQRFVKAWLKSRLIESKTFSTEKKLSDEARSQLINESSNYLYYLIRTKQDSIDGIFKSKFTVGNEAMGNIFKFPIEGLIPSSLGLGANLKKLELTDGRQGLISQPGYMAGISSMMTTNIPRRGEAIMAEFMCQSLTTPPNLAEAIKVANTQIDPNDSVAHFFDKVSKSSPLCGGCHEFVNGVGFGLEEIGSTGQFRSLDDHMKPVVADGVLIESNGRKIPYSGVGGLNNAMASSKDFQVCLTVQLFRYINARVESAADGCTISGSIRKASAKGLTFTSLFSALLTDQGFINRRTAGE